MSFEGPITALTLGAISSLHCAGMCGPLMLSLPTGSGKGWGRYLSYNTGRILTYSLLGFLFGTLGEVVAIQGWQQGLSIFSGVAILFITFVPLIFKKVSVPGYAWMNKMVVSQISSRLRKKGLLTYPVLGMLNGLLPCGIVYLALFGAVARGNQTESMLFMAFFGLGTFPALIFLRYFQQHFQQFFKNYVNRLIPVAAFMLGTLLILRGMNLGIPYVSPEFSKATCGMDARNMSGCHIPK